jgi:hypothetical protein
VSLLQHRKKLRFTDDGNAAHSLQGQQVVVTDNHVSLGNNGTGSHPTA